MFTIKKEVILVFSILLIIALLFPVVSASTIPSCDSRGTLTIDQTPASKGVVYAKTVFDQTWNRIEGTWTAIGDIAHFVSDDYQMLKKGKYDVEVRYGTQYRFNAQVFCPGYSFSCKFLNISMKDCYNNDKGFFFAEFNSKGMVSAYDLRYELVTEDARFLPYSPLIKFRELENTSIVRVAGNTYRFSVKTKSPVETFTLTHEICDKPEDNNYRKEVMECRTVCTEDIFCNDNEYCDLELKTCIPLDCETCYIPKTHVCAPLCDDGNPCSADICVDNACSHSVYECEESGWCEAEGVKTVFDNIKYFCSENREWVKTSGQGHSCEKDYECIWECVLGRCMNERPEKQKEEVEIELPEDERFFEQGVFVVAQDNATRTSVRWLFVVVITLVIFLAIILFELNVDFIKSRKKKGKKKKAKIKLIEAYLDLKVKKARIESMILEAESAIENKNFFTAKKIYTSVAEMYSELPDKEKEKLYDPLSRIHKKMRDINKKE